MLKSLKILIRLAAVVPLLLLSSCFTNNPYPPSEADANIFYSVFLSEPKHLDPARSYSEDEYEFLQQIYEPPIQYHYLKRPYTLVPLTVETVPEPRFYDKDGAVIPGDPPAEKVAKVVYEIKLRHGVKYSNHPCFAKTADGKYRWHLQPGESFPKVDHPNALKEQDTRELRAEDYVYEIKRLADPRLECPVLQVLSPNILGMEEFDGVVADALKAERQKRRDAAGVFYNQEEDEKHNPIFLDMRKFNFPGVEIVDEYTFRITLKRKYPQLIYWMAMPFFAPIPWEVDRFFMQSAAAEQNLTLDRFPLGTGAYWLSENHPNFRMALKRNPNFHPETYPCEGEPADKEAGLLKDCGKTLPFIDEAIFTLDKESAPRWTKFVQGYYDTSGINSDVFDQAINMNADGATLSDDLKKKGVRLETAVAPSTYYYSFNMLDDVVGGYDEKKKKLRQAISIALNQEEEIQIFANGRGIPAQGPIPPGIFGYQEGKEGINPYVYDWDEQAQSPKRKSLDVARKLLAEAGYPDGHDASGKQLVIGFDTAATSPSYKSQLDWTVKQFEQIGIELQIRATDPNRWQDKLLKGNFQLVSYGWNADYPDPENFLFILYGENSKVKSQGENSANYDNPKYNELFKRVENMSNTPERLALIKQMVAIAREDSPWVWGFHPLDYGLYHQWLRNAKPATFVKLGLKYRVIDPKVRAQLREEWNSPITWPLWMIFGLLVLGSVPAAIIVYQREHRGADVRR